MKLEEFRQRWIEGENPRADSIDDSRMGRVDDWQPSMERPTAWQPIRFRSRYVPEIDSGARAARLRQVAVRALTVALVFFVAAAALGAMLDYLPTYLTTYVFDR